MNIKDIVSQIKLKKSLLCVGLDTDIEKLPPHLSKDADGFLTFNKAIIDATKDFAIAYKVNTAFYEAMGKQGWDLLEKTRALLPENCFKIADAKRGDIGNTSSMYAKAFFDVLDFDALTVAPYMGFDSVAPFLAFNNKVTIVLGLTSNEGSADFQTSADYKPPLYETVIKKVSEWGKPENLMFVVGATKADILTEIRKLIPHHFLLIPGVGAQGGSASEVCIHGMNKQGGLLINSSRAILYASAAEDFADAAAREAQKLLNDVSPYLDHVFQ